MGFQYYQSILKTHKSSRMLLHDLRALCTPYFVQFAPTIQAVALWIMRGLGEEWSQNLKVSRAYTRLQPSSYFQLHLMKMLHQ